MNKLRVKLYSLSFLGVGLLVSVPLVLAHNRIVETHMVNKELIDQRATEDVKTKIMSNMNLSNSSVKGYTPQGLTTPGNNEETEFKQELIKKMFNPKPFGPFGEFTPTNFGPQNIVKINVSRISNKEGKIYASSITINKWLDSAKQEHNTNVDIHVDPEYSEPGQTDFVISGLRQVTGATHIARASFSVNDVSKELRVMRRKEDIQKEGVSTVTDVSDSDIQATLRLFQQKFNNDD